MAAFVIRLIPPRPDFALTLTDDERALMRRHAAHWQPYIDSGEMVVFGPAMDDHGSFGLAVVETADEEGLRRHAAADPVVMARVLAVEFGHMLAGFVRPR